MNSPASDPSEENHKLEIVSTRLFDAPAELVYEVFINPAHLTHWWGPTSFTNTFTEFDPRPGGAWHSVMHGPDGANYDITKEFIEVDKPSRVVFRHVSPMHRFLMTMTFAEEPCQTRLTWTMVFEDEAENEGLKRFLIEANEQNFDRLAAYLHTISG